MPKSPFEPCIPTKVAKVPDRPDWIHEIKDDAAAGGRFRARSFGVTLLLPTTRLISFGVEHALDCRRFVIQP